MKKKNLTRLTAASSKASGKMKKDDDLFAQLRNRFSERELVELSAAICWENHRARFNRTFAVESDGFSQGNFVLCHRSGGSESSVARGNQMDVNISREHDCSLVSVRARSRAESRAPVRRARGQRVSPPFTKSRGRGGSRIFPESYYPACSCQRVFLDPYAFVN